MNKSTLDIIKAIGLTIGGFLIGLLIAQSLKWISKAANIDMIYIVGILLFLVVAYANYQLIKLNK
jgi:hypothetical protein